MNKLLQIILASSVLAASGLAYADIYRCAGDDGVVVLSNLDSSKKAANCTKMVLPKKSTAKPPAKPAASGSEAGAAQAPVNPGTSSAPKDRASERKKIISSEIDLETKRLEEVRKKLKDLGKNPNILFKVNSEISDLKAQEAAHLKNIDLLKIELSK